MNNNLIDRETAFEAVVFQCNREISKYKTMHRALGNVARAALDAVKTVSPAPITGDTSDGYHTFNELYHHRAVLFSVICKAFPDKTWKSKQHHDGTMYDGMFIVGIDTPEGQATYHYDIDPYWDIFDCKELEHAPEWDGHTPAEAIERIGKLAPFRPCSIRLPVTLRVSPDAEVSRKVEILPDAGASGGLEVEIEGSNFQELIDKACTYIHRSDEISSVVGKYK